jgi:DNA-binding NarL/FixJ family response regulator
MNRKIKILLAEDDAGYARLTQCILRKSDAIEFEVAQSRTLAEVILRLGEFFFDVILLNLNLPDCQGLTTLQSIQSVCSDIPIVILAREATSNLVLEAIGRGAQDFVFSDELDSEILIRTITLAMERHHFRNDLIAQRSLALFALDRLTCGVILIGPLGSLIRTNRFAQAILSEKDGLFLERGLLQASSKQQNHCFQKLISAMLNPDGLSQTPRGGHLTIGRDGRQPLALLITTLTLESQNQRGPGNFAAIFISDPERTGKTIEEVLCRSHTLTKAEARLTCLILQGMSVADCSKKLGITINTVRGHIKKIFLKTGTTRQTDLVRLLLAAPPASED